MMRGRGISGTFLNFLKRFYEVIGFMPPLAERYRTSSDLCPHLQFCDAYKSEAKDRQSKINRAKKRRFYFMGLKSRELLHFIPFGQSREVSMLSGMAGHPRQPVGKKKKANVLGSG